MKITQVEIRTIQYKSLLVNDSEGHTHPGKEHDALLPILRISCDDGADGFAFGGGFDINIMNNVIKPAILGEDPIYREKIWQRMRTWQRLHHGFTERTLCALDLALWDIAGKKAVLPVYKLLGAYRDKVPAYGSIMVGDDLPGGLDTPQAYADFAVKLIEQGYKALKLHTWMPPIISEPDPEHDIAACAAVREAVGPKVKLMLDCYHDYSRQQACYLGRELEKLNFYWLEEPMDENSMSSYKWLSDQLDISICGPETAAGKNKTRADWIVSGASDIGRDADQDSGGITPLIKSIHLYESFNMPVDLHGNTIGNLHMLGAMSIPGEFYERGLLHPFLDYEIPKPWFNTLFDKMNSSGFVSIPNTPGLGWDINHEYIAANTVNVYN